MLPWAMGVDVAAYDGNLTNDADIPLLNNAGIIVLRYPGASYADKYHWSTHTVTPTKGNPNDKAYLANGTDFGHFALFLDRFGGTAVITVNYGSNLQSNGPGEPKEAAAWVAYANGNPQDPREIGKDSVGNDWKTVGYWASLRAGQPLANDDGFNFLRIGHVPPLNIMVWEVGNEVYSNGYYQRDRKGGWEEDLHVPYEPVETDNLARRLKNPKLSPATYGSGVVAYSKEMKAVDPRISVGAVVYPKEVKLVETRVNVEGGLNAQAGDTSWGEDWNQEVLKACGSTVDFVTLHWYAAPKTLPPDWKSADPMDFLATPRRALPGVFSELAKLLQKYAPGRPVAFSVSELGLASWIPVDVKRPELQHRDPYLLHGLFAADSYATLILVGAANIDWPELHKEPFLKDDGTPGPVYYGLAMVHRLMNWGENMVLASSSHPLLSAYAARHRDGSLGLMLINKDWQFVATVKVKINGDALSATGTRWDWGPSTPPDGMNPKQSVFSEGGNTFTIKVPAYSITDVTLPKAQ
jgi:hypothetical protein